FGKAALERGVHDSLAVRRKTRIGVGIIPLGQLPGVLTAGVHRPDLKQAAAIADEDNGPLQLGEIDVDGPLRRRRRSLLLPLARVGSWSCFWVGCDRSWFFDDRAGSPKTVAIGAEASVGVGGELLVAIRGRKLLGGTVPGAAAEH